MTSSMIIYFLPYSEAHVVLIPFVQKLSLTAIKIPSKCDNLFPCAILRAVFFDRSIANDSVRVTMAFKF